MNPSFRFVKDVRITDVDLGTMILEEKVDFIEMNYTHEGGEYKERRKRSRNVGCPIFMKQDKWSL